MKTHSTVVLLAVALVAGVAYNSTVHRTGSAPCCIPVTTSALVARADAAPPKPAPKKPAPKPQAKLVAYYFHGNFRCINCRNIEAWTGKAIAGNFSKELKSGRLQWRVVNVEEKGNEHFMKDYKLYTKSVVLSDTKNGKETRWKNLEKVWNLLGDETAFKAYIRDEIAAYLKGP